MGVQGLWDLLAPVGRRVSVETLAGKRLAIDASIWMVQFMKAMRDEKGEMVRNAHLIGFFRRICKLLFLRTKPVFVFDGATPSLKRRTIAARRRHRDQARSKLRKTAEKLLLNHLKAKKLEELAAEIKNGRQKGHDSKGKNVILNHGDDDIMRKDQALEAPGDGIGTEEGSSGGTGGEAQERGSSIHESLDELLAASLAAQDEGRFREFDAAATGVPPSKDELEDDEDEEMVFPVGSDNIDPAVLASLPPSMQLDLLVQMRERVMAENREKYQKLKKAPAKFSVLQIQSYLKTVAFRREIDQVQKHAAGRGLDGIQTSRIASEANREFIFSSSFTGDKEMLSRVAESECKDHDGAKGATMSDKTTFVTLSNQSKCDTKGGPNKLKKDFRRNVETYLDDRGLFKVSRVRGLGIRMTRDLQRNLDMMKEHEQQQGTENHCMDLESSRTIEVTGISEGTINHSKYLEASRTNEVTDISGFCQSTSSFIEDGNDINTGNDQNSTQRGGDLYTDQSDSLDISFLDDGGIREIDDDIFFELVSRSPASNLHSGSAHVECSNNSESDNIWEDEVNEIVVSPKCLNKQIAGNPKCVYIENPSSLFERDNSEEDKVEWEEGVCHDSTGTSYKDDPEKAVSHGLEEEEADIQEAIRRSLEDFRETISSAETTLGQCINNLRSSESTLQDLTTIEDIHHYSDKRSGKNPLLQPGESDVSKIDFLQRLDSSEKRLDTNVLSVFGSGPLMSNERNVTNALKMQNKSNTSEIGNHVNHCQISQAHNTTHLLQMNSSFSTPTQSIGGICSSNACTSSSDVSGIPFHANLDHYRESRSVVPCMRDRNDSNADISSLVEEPTFGTDKMQQQEKHVIEDESSIQNSFDYQMDVSEARLDEEISLLRQECTDLGNEQRKLERNAESVSSEMFAECQELLQMFGLPYIIAPMEAEAQCAYMEMAKLVDGVVTDDSDVFLFGARSVYKNIFDDRKYVETYFMKDIENELGLNREMLIRMALLLGSDYTEGVSGIGIVNAIEVVHAFPEDDGLQKFREWIESPDLTIFGKFDSNTGSNSSLRSSSKSSEDIGGKRFSVERHASEEIDVKAHGKKPKGHGDIKENFTRKHRNISKNWHIPPSFPSESVITAYTSPQVDESSETFTWGKPDLLLLRRLCWEKFGWTNKKSDELLGPVLKEYSKHETQLRLEAFYTFNERFAKIRSQRIKKALKGITGTLSSDLTDDVVKEVPELQNKSETETSTVVRRKTGNKVSEELGHKMVKDVIDSHMKEQGDCENCSALDKHRSGTERSGGSSRQRGRGRRNSAGRGSGKLETPSESSSESLSDSIAGLAQKHKELPQRMCRQKRVKYAEEDFGELEEATTEQMATGAEAEHQIVEGSCNLDVGAHQYAVDGSNEYLTSGGGFCVDENDPEGEDITGDDFERSVLEDDPLRDQLDWGAGFCTDEATEDEHTLTDTRPAGDPETCNQLSSGNAQDLEFTISERSNIQTVTQEHSEDSRSPVKRSSGTRLRAMSSLRKRRKL